MFRSLQWRIALAYVLLIVGSMGLLTVYLFNLIRGNFLDDLHTSLASEARLVATISQPYLGFPNSSEVAALAKRLGQQLESRVTIIDARGVVLGDSDEDPSRMANHLDRPEVATALANREWQSTRYSATLSKEMMYVAVPVIGMGGEVLGVARVSRALAKIDSSLNRITLVVAAAGATVTVLAMLVAIWIARRTIGSLKILGEMAGSLAGGNLDLRMYPTGQDEVGALAHAFNQMADHLKGNFGAITAERNKLVAVFTTIADGLLIVNKEGRVALMNPSAERLFGVKAAAILGHSFMEVVRDYSLVQTLNACLRSGQQQVGQVELRSGRRFLRAVVTPVVGDSSAAALILLQDLTEMRQLERTRREFVSNLSHELRTPLASIKAVVETLKDGALDEAEVARDFLDKVDAEVDRMIQMVAEMLELSRIESGEARLDLKATEIAGVVEEGVGRLRPQADRKRISLSTSLPIDLPPVTADAAKVQQVVVNLVHNAIKFTGEDGGIVVSAALAKHELIISVQDTGIGVPPENLPHLFERFYKADKSRASEGTGLGLAIAKHIVQAHGGRIWAESAEGQGSTFAFTLPLASE